MANNLSPTVRGYLHGLNTTQRYIRVEEIAKEFELSTEDMEAVARAAGALYKLTRICLVHRKRVEDYMKHLYKVPGTNKQVIKKFVRIGEGSIIYGIGNHRFIEMARAAGATYKINEGTGGTVLINLEVFDEYMEQFRQKAVPMKNPLFNPSKEGDEK